MTETSDLYADDLAPLDVPSEDIAADRPSTAPVCEFWTGRAGTGKSYQLAKMAADTPHSVLVTATTGIAAVNLGAVTLNSILGYFDTDSMRDSFLSGRLTRMLHVIAREYPALAVDEGSMMAGEQLDLLYRTTEEVNQYRDVPRSLRLILVGDFAQLPPIRARWAFDADCWRHFAANVTRLTRVWRQMDGPFLDALNFAREGRGADSAAVLSAAGCRWHTSVAIEFDGTTILPINKAVNRYNDVALDRVPGPRFCVTSRRWGRQRAEWGENKRTHEWGIPLRAEFKVGAYVMCLANQQDFTVVNGDCGHITEYDETRGAITVKLLRTGAEVSLGRIIRNVESADKPEGFSGARTDGIEWTPYDHFRRDARRYVRGQIEFYPLRLAYASTVHKAQGLTLDKVQIDIRDNFFGQPAMLYTAVSRCRTLEGIRLVGQRERYAMQCKCDVRVIPWL